MYCIEKNKILTKEFLDSEIKNGKYAKDIAIEHFLTEQAVSYYIRKHRLSKNKRSYGYQDLTGLQIGSIKILRKGENIFYLCKGGDKTYDNTWIGECKCGNIKSFTSRNLKTGKTKLLNGKWESFSCGCEKTLPDGESACRRVFSSYQKGAMVRGYDFNISLEYFKEISRQDCYYCGRKPSNTHIAKSKRGKFVYNGMDRVDNKQGYHIDNVVPCCTQCNRGKMIMGKEEFLEWVERVYNHSFGEKEYNKLKIV